MLIRLIALSTLFILTLTSHAHAARAAFDIPKGCASPKYQPTEYDLLVTGRAETREKSQYAAIVELSLQRGHAHIENLTDIVRQQQDTQVTDIIHITLKHEMQRIVQVFESQSCRQGYVTYIAFDPRSLAVRLKDAFSFRRVANAKGDLRLPQGFVLDPDSSNHLWFSVDKDDQWSIHSLKQTMHLTHQEWWQLYHMPALASPLNVSRTQTHLNVTIPAQKGHYALYVCAISGQCQALGKGFDPQQALTLAYHQDPSLWFLASVNTDVLAASMKRKWGRFDSVEDPSLNNKFLWFLLRHIDKGVNVFTLQSS